MKLSVECYMLPLAHCMMGLTPGPCDLPAHTYSAIHVSNGGHNGILPACTIIHIKHYIMYAKQSEKKNEKCSNETDREYYAESRMNNNRLIPCCPFHLSGASREKSAEGAAVGGAGVTKFGGGTESSRCQPEMSHYSTPELPVKENHNWSTIFCHVSFSISIS